ncbi:hypothetical protein ACFL17_05450 [Pseudomonadota bacterium]
MPEKITTAPTYGYDLDRLIVKQCPDQGGYSPSDNWTSAIWNNTVSGDTVDDSRPVAIIT